MRKASLNFLFFFPTGLSIGGCGEMDEEPTFESRIPRYFGFEDGVSQNFHLIFPFFSRFHACSLMVFDI